MGQTARKTQYLIVSIIGEDNLSAATLLTNLCLSAGANIMDSRMTKMGNDFSATALICGRWANIAKIEAALPNLASEHGIEYLLKRTDVTALTENVLQYTVQITTVDKPGIMHSLAKFFRDHGISIDDITSETYVASRTSTDMFRMNMTVNIPDSIMIMNLREQFMTYCEHKNLDAILIEPQKY